MSILTECTKDEIIQIFRSVVNPALTNGDTEFKKLGWTTDLQISDPENPLAWLDNTLSSKIHATKAKGGQEFIFAVWAQRASSDISYNIRYQREKSSGGVGGGIRDGDYPGDINEIRKRILEDIKYGLRTE